MFINALEMSKKKVELYGISLADIFITDFISTMKKSIFENSVKFRILIKNPHTCDFPCSWSDNKHLQNTLKILSILRETNKKIFDKKCNIRLSNRMNYFSYSRFDQQIYVVHHLGQDYASDASIVHQHWKNEGGGYFEGGFK